MNITLKNWFSAIGIAAILSGAYVILDGPPEAELAKAQAADLADAKAQAHREAVYLHRCHQTRGPRAELVMIAGSDDYACRLPEDNI